MSGPAEKTVSLDPFFSGLKATLAKATGDGLTRRRGEAELGAAADRAGQAYDDAVKGLRDWVPPDRPLACRAGCTHCCHVTVAADGATIMRIARYIKDTLAPDQRARTVERIGRHQEARAGSNPAERIKRRDACPLLEDGRCTVYPVRPLVCRSFNSMDVATCEREIRGEATPAGIDAWRIPWLVGLAVNQGLMEGLAAIGLTDGELELVPALAIALRTEDAARNWLADGNPFADARWTGAPPDNQPP